MTSNPYILDGSFANRVPAGRNLIRALPYRQSRATLAGSALVAGIDALLPLDRKPGIFTLDIGTSRTLAVDDQRTVLAQGADKWLSKGD